jgi:hypothetical protein
MRKSLITVVIALLAVSAFSADLDTIQVSLDKVYNACQMMYMCQALMFGFFIWWTMRLN